MGKPGKYCCDAECPSEARWPASEEGGDCRSLQVAHQTGRRRISKVSGNSWDHFMNVLRVFSNFLMKRCPRFVPPSLARLDCRHCMIYDCRYIDCAASVSHVGHSHPRLLQVVFHCPFLVCVSCDWYLAPYLQVDQCADSQAYNESHLHPLHWAGSSVDGRRGGTAR